jgi:uncharacterized membrane protein YdbT with pleckstrin-like domain
VKDGDELIHGETTVLSVIRHPVVFYQSIAKTVILSILTILFLILSGPVIHYKGLLGQIRLILGGVIIFLLVINLAYEYLRWQNQRYTITNERVILKSGLVGKFSKSIALERIQDVQTYQSLAGRMANFGNVKIESAGRDGAEVLGYIPNPNHFRDELFQQLHPDHPALRQ